MSAQFAESTSIAQEMIQLKYPLYFYPILKSRFTPDDVKSLILSLFIVLARKTDTQYFVKQELTSLLLLQLQYTKAQSIHQCLVLLQQMVGSNVEYYREASRKAALIECLDAFVQYAQPYA